MSNKNLIIFSTSYWDSPLKFRRHQFARIASENGYQVIYINPTFTFLSFFQDVDARKTFFGFFKKALRISPSLTVYTMPPLLPFQNKIRFINRINYIISGKIIKQIAKKHFRSQSYIQLVYVPEDYYRISMNKNIRYVYDCVDEHSQYPWNVRFKDKILALEQKLIRRASLLSLSSNYLLTKKKVYNSNHLLVPNGVDFKLFNAALLEKTEIPPDIINISSPVILYVGAIMEWFDYELLVKIATYNKEWNIVLIGPQTINQSLLRKYANIHMLGVKKQSLLPGYLKKSSVCIIPFLVNDLVKGVNPLKLYEYLAAGKPVVSSALPDVSLLEKKDAIHIGKTHEEFISHVDYFINNSNSKSADQRVEIAKEFSWENIYRKLFGKIEELN